MTEMGSFFYKSTRLVFLLVIVVLNLSAIKTTVLKTFSKWAFDQNSTWKKMLMGVLKIINNKKKMYISLCRYIIF